MNRRRFLHSSLWASFAAFIPVGMNLAIPPEGYHVTRSVWQKGLALHDQCADFFAVFEGPPGSGALVEVNPPSPPSS